MKSGISVTTIVQDGKTTTAIHTREFSDAEIEDALKKEDSFRAHLQLWRQMHPGSSSPSKPPVYIISGPGGYGIV